MLPVEFRRRHLERLERRTRRLDERSRRISWARLAVVVTGAVVVFWIFRAYGPDAGTAVLGAFLLAFLALVRLHDRVDDGLEQTRRARRIKELHESRRRLDWPALPEARPDVDPQRRPFAADLNLVGSRSVHHLVDGCASRGGSTLLRDWLCDPAPALEGAMARQRLVRELTPLGLFRDHLTRVSMIGASRGYAPWDDRALREWLGRAEVIPSLKSWLIGLSLFSAANVGLILAHIAGVLPMIWPVTLLIYFAVYFMKYRDVKDLFDESQDLDLMLRRFVPALLYIERFQFKEGSEGGRVANPMREARPSIRLQSVRRIAAGAAVTRSEFLWLLLNVLLPWNMLFTYLLHRTKAALRDHLPAWLEAWYTLEAASSLAAHAEHHPGRVFPELRASFGDAEAIFAGRGLGHPLLPERDKVRNDFVVDRLGRVVLITGSNMSGKSTFLRTIGVNLHLAFAGAPVDASAMQTLCFRVFTSINVVDSVQEGLSHFYAEVRRLKMLLDALDDDKAHPSFNLIDEIFRGTNNRERLIGSRAFIRALAGTRAVSLIATHDLELTALEDEVPELGNFHFREDVSGQRMTFDYVLRPGPSPTTNALKIMAQAGLPVDPRASGAG